MKNLLTLFLVLCLTACVGIARSNPLYELTTSYDPDAPPEWKLGWQHGCESGLSAYGNDYHKTLYQFKQDVSMINDPYYFKGWNDSYNFCRSRVNRSLAGDSFSKEESPTLLSTKNLDFKTGNKRNSSPISRTGIFTGQDNKGFFSSMFDVTTPGYGGTKFGSDPYNGTCDWLNRCGADKPRDPFNALWGDWD